MLPAATRQLPLAASRVGLGRALPAAFAAPARRTYATPAGPPPSNFRVKKPQNWENKESMMDRAGNYFLMTEMLRGMYLLLEQFFRPPCVASPATRVHMGESLTRMQLHDLLPLREGLFGTATG